jgi:drug/metabolite transporter (DMT)-like permease
VLLTAGQQHVDAGLAGIVLASQPVWAAIMTATIERQVQVNVVVGVLLGLAGVILLFVQDLELGSTSGLWGLALVGAAFCYAAGTVYIERVIPGTAALTTATAAMTVSAVVLLPFAIGSRPGLPSLETAGWLVVLGVVATGGALVLFYELVRRMGAVRAGLAGYFAPGFAVGYGVVLLGEGVRDSAVVGLGLILVGTYFASKLTPL